MRVWCSYYDDGIGWFRFFGRGLAIKDVTRYPLLFSQRYGYDKAITIGKWRISYVKYKNI